jgi:hypothetical protein
MPRRADERRRNLADKDGLRWCTICQKWYSPVVADEHDHFGMKEKGRPTTSNAHTSPPPEEKGSAFRAAQSASQDIRVAHRYSELQRGGLRGSSLGLRWRWWRMKRTVRGLVRHPWRKLLILSAVIYGGLALIHVSNGFSAAEAAAMPVGDVRMAITCPGMPEVVWTFIDRSLMESTGVRLALAAGEDIYGQVCARGGF